ncbi:hypothetical protein Calhy_0430 [Caldicellulosiruptor hydrothermalis 108]|uniref:Uncharacterized protein n=1 Tax=Caldicellulosiruptor hydrothermalis (strain DSM 18901 / VKM B-2411 / 108) TaxID=632292 RepID=E4QC03_CALH1|nr:hypothetical protein [Caldicellulosiruptor hydrothermalis]ADQ06177.1 hypothetical protein Calhy_0430 [Caldicellulosiruptor hydrothermalis 108]
MGVEIAKVLIIAVTVVAAGLVIGLTKANYTISIKIGTMQIDIKKEVVS